MGNVNNKAKSKNSFTQLTSPLHSFIRASSINKQFRGNRSYYSNFILIQQIYESDLMKCIDSNEILEFIGNFLSSMNSQVLSRKYNNELYSSLFAEFMKEIDNEEENECHNVFGLNSIFLQNGIIYNENNSKDLNIINEGNITEFPFKFGNIPIIPKHTELKNEEIHFINIEINNNHNDDKNSIHNDNDNKCKNTFKRQNNNDNKSNDNQIPNNNDLNIEHKLSNDINNSVNSLNILNIENNNENNNIILPEQKDLSTISPLPNQIPPQISFSPTISSNKPTPHNIIDSKPHYNNVSPKNHKQNILLTKTITNQSNPSNNIQRTNQLPISTNENFHTIVDHPHRISTKNVPYEFEINLNNTDINNSNTFLNKNEQHSINNSISLNFLPSVYNNINNTYDKINLTIKSKSNFKNKSLNTNKSKKHMSNKKSDTSSIKSNLSSTLFKIDIKELMRDENEKNISNQNIMNEYKTKIIPKPEMTTSSFMKCLDKFLGFDRSQLKKKQNLTFIKIKHRPYNRYSYFNTKKDTFVDNDGFNTITGRGIMNDLKINNSVNASNKRQNSFVKGSAVKNEGKINITKKKKIKNAKVYLNYEFKNDFFEDNRNNLQRKAKKDNNNKGHEIKTTDLKEKENFNLSDSEKFFSAHSSYYSQED